MKYPFSGNEKNRIALKKIFEDRRWLQTKFNKPYPFVIKDAWRRCKMGSVLKTVSPFINLTDSIPVPAHLHK